MNAVRRFAIFVLLLLGTGAFGGLFVSEQATNKAGGDPVSQLIFGLLYLMIAAWILPRSKEALSLLWQERWMLLLLLLALASTLWSLQPGETFRRALGLCGTTMAGIFIGMHYEPKDQIRVLSWCVVIAAVSSLLAGLLIPHIGIMPEGDWQGTFYLKNALGRMMALGIVCFAFLGLSQRRYRVASVAMIGFCGLLLLLAKSATGLVVCVAVLALLPFRQLLARSYRKVAVAMAILLVVGMPVGLWALKNADNILSMLGRESTLTGRLPLWRVVKAEILERPLLGSGYAAFWSTPAADHYRDILGWDAPNAHNGYLEMALGLGFIGLAIFGIGMLRNFFRALKVTQSNTEIEMAWPLFFVIFCCFYNFTESTLFMGNSVFWTLYTANAYWLVRASAARYATVESPIENYSPLASPAGEFSESPLPS
jgi:exopolysaccharide production protein ExoQ